ncbi:MAG: Sterol 3-beta-glucosyltransferase [Pycnora praestabilis]|nr:MAG: Sterol 3-beta-glucosyltransferase [Pycnora praestabilis]
MPPEEDLKRRIGRKLTKKRPGQRGLSAEVPEKFKDGEDANEDAAALKEKEAQYMNQSVFSMIAAAGSKADFHSRFDDDTSDSDEEPQPEKQSIPSAVDEHAKDTNELQPKSLRLGNQSRKSSNHNLFKSIPKLHLRTKKEKSGTAQDSSSTTAESPESASHTANISPRDAPVMSRMLEAQAQLDFANLVPQPQSQDEGFGGISSGSKSPTSLALRLKEIFGLEVAEEVISEYPCWLLKSVLLQGYMYITQRHICFYAYLPKKSNIVAKSGHLAKRGRQNPKFNRYWFVLKGDVLSYYNDPSDLYFPSGNVDLRYGISAALSDHKEKGKETTHFSVTTHQRTYFFRADSIASAKEWVKTLQKVIFRSHNDGDSVKISLPIENIIDIEDSPVIEFAETFKIRVIDSDETYAIDEYFFSFFSFGRDALNVLRILVDETPAQKLPANVLSSQPASDGRDYVEGLHKPRGISQDDRLRSPLESSTPILREAVRATLAPISPTGSGRASPRASGEWGRSSFDASRRSLEVSKEIGHNIFERGRRSGSTSRNSLSLSRGRREDKFSPSRPQGSSDSFVHSLEHGPESSTAIHSSDDTQASASQILNRSDVFLSPTIHRLQDPSANITENTLRRRSSDTTKLPTMNAEIRVHPPTWSQTQRSSLERRQGQAGDASDEADIDNDPQQGGIQHSNSSPTLQELVKAGAYPLQRAAGFAGFLKTRSKRMSNLLATESMGYIEKVSGMWAGGRKHYGEAEGLVPDDQLDDLDDEEEALGHGDRFRTHFALSSTEKLQATYFGYLHRVLPLYGKVYISNRNFCFRSLLPGTRTKMILPLKDVENVDKEKGFRFGYSGLVIVIRGHEELFFEFSQADVRDDCAITLLQNLESVKFLKESGLLSQDDKDDAQTAIAEHKMLQKARQDGHNEHDIKLPETTNETYPLEAPPILFDDPRASIINFKPTESLRITCLTIGSRGDVQPYIALCKALLAEGHKPRIATHAEFEPWVRQHGIEFAPVDGDPAELMRICVENGMFTYSFLREASVKFRGWIDELLTSAWTACQDTDLLVESPSAMAGIHIAEALGIPYFRAFTMPWTRTRAYPHAFAVPDHKMGGAYNYITYVMFDNVFWKAIAGQVNRWRKKELGLRSTNLDKMQPNKVPFLYNFSPSVVVPPLDYSDWIRVTGYWFLDEAGGWEPPHELLDFIKRAREDQKKIVYIGFGSIVVSDPTALTKTVVDSVLKADVRCILSKGWSDRLGNKDAAKPEVPLPAEILQIKSAPHDWLFRQIDAAVHHGGAGTTGASLRAGLPTIVKPFFGDQFFFGSRVEDLGVGVYMKKLNVSVFSRALWETTHSERMIIKAKVLGEQIRKEDGVGNAIQSIYRDMEYAKTLIKKHGANMDDAQDDVEENWTFIGDESDPELTRRIAEWEPMARFGQGDRSVTPVFGIKANQGVGSDRHAPP